MEQQAHPASPLEPGPSPDLFMGLSAEAKKELLALHRASVTRSPPAPVGGGVRGTLHLQSMRFTQLKDCPSCYEPGCPLRSAQCSLLTMQLMCSFSVRNSSFLHMVLLLGNGLPGAVSQAPLLTASKRLVQTLMFQMVFC